MTNVRLDTHPEGIDQRRRLVALQTKSSGVATNGEQKQRRHCPKHQQEQDAKNAIGTQPEGRLIQWFAQFSCPR